MFKNKKFIVFLVVALVGITFCQAAKEVKLLKGLDDDDDGPKSSWFEFGFMSPLQMTNEETAITVFRFSALYTYNKSVSGYDAGVVCYSAGKVNGLQTAWSNHTDGIMNGLTVGLFNVAEIEMNGMQLGIYNRAGSDSTDNIASKTASSAGTQWGWANCADAVFSGFQLGITNVSTTLFQGLQIGAVNIAQEPDKMFDAFQSKKYKDGKGKKSCFQIGLINFNPNGFLPVTLLINF